MTADGATLAEQAVDALGETFGRHPGFRAAHAKGVLYRGTFTATPEAAQLSRAAHLQGKPVEVTVRFSNAPGDPARPDGGRGGRGMAAKFYLPDGMRTDIIGISTPRFFARSPEEFVSVIRAGRRGRLRLLRVLLLFITHPRAALILRSGLRKLPLRSYACCRYDALHSYKWVDSTGGERFVRYRWLPEAGEASMPVKEAKRQEPDYLQHELRARVEREPVRFTLQLALAAADDRVEDSSVAWPEERETVAAGTLELTEPDTQRETGDDVLVFDPTRVVDGIELSDDPVLRFRRPAYSISVERRSALPATDLLRSGRPG
jgi:catalase